MRYKVLIVDDEPDFIGAVEFALKGFDFITATSAEEAKARVNDDVDVIMLDLNLEPSSSNMEGLDLLDYFKKEFPQIPVTVITGYGTVEIAVEAMRKGAEDFLKKGDMDVIEWKKRIELLAQNKALKIQIADYEREKYSFVGVSQSIVDIKNTLNDLGQNSQITVLLRGETGVGKEVAAKYLHSRGERMEKPFVVVHISTIQSTLLESALFGHKKGAFTGAYQPRQGYFRKADSGVLFLDEIGDLNLESQSKILRFLENRVINVLGDEKDIQLDIQVVTATNKDLKKLVYEGTFREDLYYRINNFTVDIPPLRERKEDIPILMSHFLDLVGYGQRKGMVAESAMDIMIKYDWPGNVREMRNAIDYSLIKSRGNTITKQHLPIGIIPRLPSPTLVSQEQGLSFPIDIAKQTTLFQLRLIDSAIYKAHGSKSKAAQSLGLDLDQLRYKISTVKDEVRKGNFKNIVDCYQSLFKT